VPRASRYDTMLEDVFLSYKIERSVIKGFEADTEFSLNSITETPLPLDSFSIEVDEAKLAYLKDEKSGSMERAGLSGVTSDELAKLIRQKINASYIYNMVSNAARRLEV
jgi:hypothetical protein